MQLSVKLHPSAQNSLSNTHRVLPDPLLSFIVAYPKNKNRKFIIAPLYNKFQIIVKSKIVIKTTFKLLGIDKN